MSEHIFRLHSVEKTCPPEGVSTGSWHKYVIENDSTTIYGYKRGSRTQVTRHAREYIEALNAKNDPSVPKKGVWGQSRRQKR